MAENSKIEWTSHTFNPWRGCTKVSAGCQRCYAETLSGRNPKTLGVWGPNGTRVVAAEAQWREPVRWNAGAEWWCDSCRSFCFELHGTCRGCASRCRKPGPAERPRVFCASLADVFEDWTGPMKNAAGFDLWHIYPPSGTWASNPGDVQDKMLLTMQGVRARLFALIDATPNLDWLLLTKRPENIARMVPRVGFPDAGVPGTLGRYLVPPNVWIGTSVEDRKALARIDVLRKVPSAVRFLSVEPLLEDLGIIDLTGIHWVIVGGESGHDARSCRVEWMRSLVKQCKAAGVPVFVKQLGSNPRELGEPIGDTGFTAVPQLRLRDRKGGDMDEWPEDLRVRQFPTPAGAPT